MAKQKCKGTILQQEIATVFTAVAQVISLSISGNESETVEADTLDNGNAGIPHEPTGRSEGGSVEGELFYDPALAGHQSVTDLITDPKKCNWKVIYADTGATEVAFTSAGVGFDVSIDSGDLLKGSFNAKVDGLPTWPT